MRKFYSLLQIFIFVIAIFYDSVSYSQWKPTNGLFSGDVHSVITSNGEIISGTNQIYKSTDNGKTWFVSNNGISGSVTQINTLTKISTYLIAGTDAGVFYSTDNGNNWTISAGTSNIGVFCMVVKDVNLFMSTFGSGVYKSTTNGVTWTAVNNGISNITWMRAIAVKGNDLYAATDGYGIYKSTNDGGNWNTVNTGLPGSFYSVSALAVDHDTILAGTYGAGIYRLVGSSTTWSAINNGVSSSDMIIGMGIHGSTVYASTLNGNLYKTTNNTTWNAVSPGNIIATRFEAFYSDGNTFYVGSWGGSGASEQSYGLFKTPDNGQTWKHIGITDYPVSCIEISGSNILAGTNDISGNSFRIPLFKTSETDSVWLFNMGGFVGKNITALKSSGAIAYLFDFKGSGESQIYRSTNNGNNWTSTGYSELYSYFTRFVIAGSLVYAADNSPSSSRRVVVSADNGQIWTSVTSGIPTSVLYSYDLVLKGTTLFLGTDNGVYKNTVGQNNWTACSSGLTNMYIKALWVSGNDLYAGTQGGGVFKSSNDGGQWNDVSTGIPLFTNFTCFTGTTGKIFAGTDNGVFLSTNGTSWNSVNTGLVDTSITAINASANYLWAGTTAHGVWKRQLSEFIAGAPPQPGPITGSTTVCHGSSNTYSVALVSGATSYTWTLPNGWSGSSTTNSINTIAGTSGTISVTANNSYGSSAAQTLYVTVTTVNTGVTQSGLTLTANAAGAGYVWIDCSNYLPVGGQTSQSFTALNAGDYAVIVTQNGCSDTSACYTADTVCNISVSGSDMPYDGFTAILSVDTITTVTIGSSGASQSWDYSNLTYQYQKYSEYHLTSSTPYASTFPSSNLYTYGPGYMYGSLFGSAPVGSTNNGYVFWKSDNTGFWDVGWRPDGGTFAGVNVQVNTPELLVASPATYGSIFNNESRWELPMNNNASDPDTFYVRTANKIITADACGSLTTPYDLYPNVLREHEYVIHVDSIYYKSGSTTILAYEYLRDTMNNYMYIANGVGYPVCTVHADKNDAVLDVEYYAGPYTSIHNYSNAENSLLLYPNPSGGKIFIEIPEFDKNSFSNIFIYNSFGSLIWQKNTPDKNVSADLSGNSKGIYIVKVYNGNHMLTKKIILE